MSGKKIFKHHREIELEGTHGDLEEREIAFLWKKERKIPRDETNSN